MKMKKTYFFVILSFICGVALFLVFYFQSQFVQISLKTAAAGTPCVITGIEGRQYTLGIDLGSKYPLSLSKDILDAIHNKIAQGAVQWKDAQGKTYEAPSYLIPQISIGNLVLTNVIAAQEDDNFITNTTLWNDNQYASICQKSGTLGRPVLEKTNLLMDFPNSIMLASNDKKALKRAGIFLDKMVAISFETGNKGIILKVDTDLGILRLSLDTGATFTLIRSSCFQGQSCVKDNRGFFAFTTSKFSIGDANFGEKRLLLYNITSELHEIDGFLGMDFLEHHVIYIDYQNKILYLDPPVNDQ